MSQQLSVPPHFARRTRKATQRRASLESSDHAESDSLRLCGSRTDRGRQTDHSTTSFSQPITRRRPRIIYAGPFPEYTQRIYNFQCNCACPDDGFSLESDIQVDFVAPLKQAATHRQPLTHEYALFFNPLRDNGPVVLNDIAIDIWQQFAQPKSLSSLHLCQEDKSAVEELVATGLLEHAAASVSVKRKPPKVLSTWIHVTNECNLRCDYCYIRKTSDDMSEEIGRAAVDAIFRSATQHGFQTIKLKFAGGEATLNLRRVFDIHDYAVTKSHDTGIFADTVILSNGVSIGPRAMEEFQKRGINVSISLDGIGEAHDSQRVFANGVGSFACVNRTLERLISKGFKPFISITLSDRNAEDLPNVIRYVVDRDLPFNINFYRENDCSLSFTDLRLRDDKVIDAMKRAFAVLEANLPSRSLLGSLVDRAQFDQPHDKTCSVGDSYIVVDHRGNVAKCQMEIERVVADVWADDPLALIQADKTGIQNISVDEKEGCKTCEWKYWCAGGCPALTFRATGRYDVKSPNCRIYKALYPEMLRLEGLRLIKLAGGWN